MSNRAGRKKRIFWLFFLKKNSQAPIQISNRTAKAQVGALVKIEVNNIASANQNISVSEILFNM